MFLGVFGFMWVRVAIIVVWVLVSTRQVWRIKLEKRRISNSGNEYGCGWVILGVLGCVLVCLGMCGCM